MVILWTIIVCIGVIVVQGFILGLLGVALTMLFSTPAYLLSRGVEQTDRYAAKHSMRIHLVAWFFTAGRYIAEIIEFGIALLLILWLSNYVNFWLAIPVIISLIIFGNNLSVASMGQSTWFHGASRRLFGQSIELYDSYAAKYQEHREALFRRLFQEAIFPVCRKPQENMHGSKS